MRKLNISLVGLLFATLLLASTSYARDETVSAVVEQQKQENDETRSLTEHTLAFPEDGLAAEGTPVDAKMLAGLTVAKERGMTAPGVPAASSADAGQEG